jgi:septal ring factor EnvC (AmiA/AmiB activator)
MQKEDLDQIKSIIDDSVNKGFENQAIIINGAFQTNQEYMDEKFDKVEGRLNKVETGLDKVDTRLYKVENRLDKVDTKIERIEGKLDKALYVEYISLERRVKKIEDKKS